jgi:hypothetical protein
MGRRALTVFVAASLLAYVVLLPAGGVVVGQEPDELPPTRVFFTMFLTSVDGKPVFVNDTLILPGPNTIVNITLINNDLDPGLGALHTFTINNGSSGAAEIDAALTSGETMTVEFLVVSLSEIVYGGRSFVPEVEAGAIRFYCVPHWNFGMIGKIFIGGALAEPAEQEEQQIFLRAYWIGLIGFGGTILLIIVSYYLIKSSSRHFRDQKEHIRRGFP